jgi:D-mannonate dehydratase
MQEPDGSFYEAEYPRGSSDMVGVICALLREEVRRKHQNRLDREIPMRPDHGHLLADDLYAAWGTEAPSRAGLHSSDNSSRRKL